MEATTHEPPNGPERPGRSGAGTPGTLPLLLTVDETATVLRTTRKAVYAMIERAQLPGVTRLGRRVLIDRAELLQWLLERRAPSPGRTRR